MQDKTTTELPDIEAAPEEHQQGIPRHDLGLEMENHKLEHEQELDAGEENPKLAGSLTFDLPFIPEDIIADDWGADWWAPIKEYFQTDELSKDKWRAQKLRIISINFCIIKGSFFKRGVSDPYLLCIYGEGI